MLFSQLGNVARDHDGAVIHTTVPDIAGGIFAVDGARLVIRAAGDLSAKHVWSVPARRNITRRSVRRSAQSGDL